jgi:Pectate lyase superfamily protein
MPNDEHAPTIDVRQYGARGDGVHDDTDAIQQAFAAASQNHLGATVLLPPGSYKISRTLTLSDVTGLVVKGSGGRTRLQWAGNATAPLLELGSLQHSRFEDFSVNASSAAPLAIGIRMMTAPGTVFVSRHNVFRQLNLDGTNGGLGRGVQIGGGIDANNDFHRFDDCSVSNYTYAAFTLENTQVYEVLFDNCLAVAWGDAPASAAVRAFAGNFHWRGGGAGSHSDADFVVWGSDSAFDSVQNATFEGSNRFVRTMGPSGAFLGMRLESCRWAGNGLNADGIAINYQYPGPLTIRGCHFDSDPARELVIEWNPGGLPDVRNFIFQGNYVRAASLRFFGYSPTLEQCTTLMSE